MGKLLDNLGKWESAILWKRTPSEGVEGAIIGNLMTFRIGMYATELNSMATRRNPTG